jgi:hypothetical protein
MHKYVVMAHADDPATLAQLIVDTATQQLESITETERVMDFQTTQHPDQLSDVVVLFEIPHDLDEEAFKELDLAVRRLAPDTAVRVETMRGSTEDEPHAGAD